MAERYNTLLSVRSNESGLTFAVGLLNEFENVGTPIKDRKKLEKMISRPICAIEEIDPHKGYRASIINPHTKKILECKYSFSNNEFIFNKVKIKYSLAH